MRHRKRWTAAMTLGLALLLGILVAGASGATEPAIGIDRVAWLEGVWTSEDEGAVTEERWGPPAGGSMLATSRTVSGGRTVFFEFLRIEERDGGLVYLAQPKGRAPATPFTATRITESEAIFENPEHDFPKRLAYRLDGDELRVEVSGDGSEPEKGFEVRYRRAAPAAAQTPDAPR